MPQIIFKLADELVQAVAQSGDRLPEWLTQALTQPAMPVRTYQHMIECLAAHPTLKQIANFRSTPAMSDQLRKLFNPRSQAHPLTPAEVQELAEVKQLLLNLAYRQPQGLSNLRNR